MSHTRGKKQRCVQSAHVPPPSAGSADPACASNLGASGRDTGIKYTGAVQAGSTAGLTPAAPIARATHASREGGSLSGAAVPQE
jgi:hypothetical protein